MADNITTPYLGQSESADNLNTGYLGTGSASTEAEENPRTFSSEVSFTDVVSMDGVLTLNAALNSASGVSGGAITGTTGSYSGQVSAQTLSFDTLAGSGITVGSSTPDGILWVTVGASGLSVGLESGGSLYWINSTVSAA